VTVTQRPKGSRPKCLTRYTVYWIARLMPEWYERIRRNTNGRMPMGFASCLEDNIDKVHDNKHMRGDYELRRACGPMFATTSPPLQPVLVVMPPPEPVAKREALCAKGTFSLSTN
jgi:hypothetical protein